MASSKEKTAATFSFISLPFRKMVSNPWPKVRKLDPILLKVRGPQAANVVKA